MTRSRFHRLATWTTLLVALAGPLTARAGMDWKWDVGVRGGFDDGESRADVRDYEVFAARRLPWQWSWGKDWILGTIAYGTAGTPRGEGKHGFVATLGPGVVLGRRNGRISFEGASAFTYLSQHIYRDLNLGGSFQFTSHIAFRLDLWRGLGISYGMQHTSNGGIHEPNPGIDMHIFSLSYRF